MSEKILFDRIVLPLVFVIALQADQPTAFPDDIPEIFNGKSLDNWSLENGKPVPAGWEVVEGVIHRKPGKKRVGHIVTRKKYQDFDLSFEWKIAPGGNSGIKYRVKKYGGRMLGCEYQILDRKKPNHPPGNQDTGALYGLYAPDPLRVLNPAGQFNLSRIIVRGDEVEHWLNGKRIVLATVGSADWETRIAKSKFNDVPEFARQRAGRIMLTDHGAEVWYRNLKIRMPLPANDKKADPEQKANRD